ncbi:MAG TPA: hypothetical protein VLN59_09365 [Burkholderiales bacterium]|nr:hypothetical protein [Burkholderiales bacterium]
MHWFAAVLFLPSALLSALNEAPDPGLFRRGVVALRDRQYSQAAELFLPPETEPAKPPAASAAESELNEFLATAPDGAALNVLALLPVQRQRTTGAQSLSRLARTIATHLAGPLGKLPRTCGAEVRARLNCDRRR